MTTIRDLVEDEARRGEDDDAGDDVTDDTPVEASAPPATEPLAELPPFDPKKLEAELRRHEREMAKVLGEGWADMKACDTCGGAGFVPSAFEPLPEVVADPFAVACPDCHAYGLRSTPSLRDGNQTITCDACGGAGWRDRRQLEAMQAAAAYQAAPTYAAPLSQPTWNTTTQQWETPNGTPAYAPPPPPPLPPPA